MNSSPQDTVPSQAPVSAVLTWAETVVLVATRSIKPTYGGISNYRFHTARRETGITPDQWDAAKQMLICRGLLKPSTAITDAGRNAVLQFSSLSVLQEMSTCQTVTRA